MRPQAERLMLKLSTASHDIPHGEQGPRGDNWERTEEMSARNGQEESSVSLASFWSQLAMSTHTGLSWPTRARCQDLRYSKHHGAQACSKLAPSLSRPWLCCAGGWLVICQSPGSLAASIGRSVPEPPLLGQDSSQTWVPCTSPVSPWLLSRMECGFSLDGSPFFSRLASQAGSRWAITVRTQVPAD